MYSNNMQGQQMYSGYPNHYQGNPYQGQMSPLPQQYNGYQMPQGMNNYPIQGQAPNMTQSGVSFDYLRQLLANKLNTLAAKQDAQDNLLLMRLYQEAVGPYNNFLTAIMDDMVEMASVTLDYLMLVERQFTDINAAIEEAVKDALWCTWSNQSNVYPNLMTENFRRRYGEHIKNWENQRHRRLNQFHNAGLLNNYAPQNVNAWNTNAGVMPGQMNPMVGQPPMRNMNPNQGLNPQSFHNGQMVPRTPGYRPMANTGYRPVNQQTTHYQPNTGMNGWRNQGQQNPSQSNGMRYKPNGDPYLRRNPVDEKLEELEAKRQNTSTSSYQPQTQSYQPTQTTHTAQQHGWGEVDLSNVNQVPPTRKVLPDSVTTGTRIKQPDGSVFETDWVATSPRREGIVETDFSNVEQLTERFAQAKNPSQVTQQVANTPSPTEGLKDDEVKLLTRSELRALLAQGKRFEPPYLFERGADPFLKHKFFILLKNGYIRQEVYDLGAPMRFDVHFDVLRPTREDPVFKNNPLNKKLFHTSTIGGVEFDRFKQSKIVLRQGLKKSYAEPDPVKAKELKRQAYRDYEKQIALDNEEYITGRATLRHLYPEDPNLPDEEQEWRKHNSEEREKQMREMHDKYIEHFGVSNEKVEVIVSGGLYDNQTARILDEIRDEIPESDNVKTTTFSHNTVAKVFNNLEEKEKVEEVLRPFYQDYMSTEGEEIEPIPYLNMFRLSEVLKEAKGKIPVDLWQRLENKGTALLNAGLRYSFGLTIAVESFTEDMKELMGVLYGKFKDRPNFEAAMLYLHNHVVSGLATLTHDAGVVIEDAEGHDVLNDRVVMTTELYRETLIPKLSSEIGLNGEEVIITKDDTSPLYEEANRLVVAQLGQFLNGANGQLSIGGVYITTLDGVKYRVYANPMNNKDRFEEYKEGEENKPFSITYTLVKVPVFI